MTRELRIGNYIVKISEEDYNELDFYGELDYFLDKANFDTNCLGIMVDNDLKELVVEYEIRQCDCFDLFFEEEKIEEEEDKQKIRNLFDNEADYEILMDNHKEISWDDMLDWKLEEMSPSEILSGCSYKVEDYKDIVELSTGIYIMFYSLV